MTDDKTIHFPLITGIRLCGVRSRAKSVKYSTYVNKVTCPDCMVMVDQLMELGLAEYKTTPHSVFKYNRKTMEPPHKIGYRMVTQIVFPHGLPIPRTDFTPFRADRSYKLCKDISPTGRLRYTNYYGSYNMGEFSWNPKTMTGKGTY